MKIKTVLYLIMVICFVIAGLIDLKDGANKQGVLALVYATANAIIFLWR